MPLNIGGTNITSVGVKVLNDTSPIPGSILHLDAGIAASYPGSGTTWYDLSGNGNHGTLNNGVSFSTANGGVLICDGVDDYIQINAPNLTSTNYTVVGAGRYVTIDAPIYPASYEAGRIFSAASNNWLLGWWAGYTENYYAEGWISGVGAGTSDTNWKIMTGTGNISGDQYSLFTNGILTINNSNAGSQGPNGFSLGRYGPGGTEYANCAIGFMLVYNRILTAQEVLQNFQSQRQRFGI